MNRAALLATALGAALVSQAACSASPPPSPSGPTSEVIPTPPPVAPLEGSKSDQDLIAIALRAAPSGFQLDGDVAEWGSLRPVPAQDRPDPPLVSPRRGVDPEPEAILAKGPQAQNPREATSLVAWAITEDGARVALDVGGAAAHGAWIGVGSPPPLVAPIGQYTRGGGFDEVVCTPNEQDYREGARFDTGKPNPPEVIAACQALLARYAKIVATHEARFARLFRVDASGVRVATADGTLAPVDGAKLAWKAHGDRATAEIMLPLGALPRLSQAPLLSMELVARPASSEAPPALPRTAWIRATMPAPLSFGPLGELRARVFAPLDIPPDAPVPYLPPRGLSFQPGDGAHVESIDWTDGTAMVAPNVELLYQPREKLGDLEIGDVSAQDHYIAVYRGEKLINLVSAGGARRGIVKRHGEVHLVNYVSEDYAMAIGIFTPPGYVAWAIKPDGTERDAVQNPEDGGFSCVRYEHVEPFTASNLEILGFRGRCIDYDYAASPWIEVTWRWNGASGLYEQSWKKIPPRKVAAR